MFAILTAALLATTAHAGPPKPDLVTSIANPGPTEVYTAGRTYVTVSNQGNATASTVKIVIQLPKTHTSPQVYVLGTLGAKHSSCVLSGTKYTCTIGSLAKNKSSTVFFDIALPWSSEDIVVTSTATTTTTESNPNNNGDCDTANVTYVDAPFSGDLAVDNDHCTGQGLTAWYECTLFPSSISSHSAILHDDGTITFPEVPGYGGFWELDPMDSTYLYFEYNDGTDVVATFDGNGTGDGCWEGLTTFPNSPYVAPYLVCPAAP